MDHDLEAPNTGFSEDLLTSFALFLSNEIHSFYQSDKGKEYYENWLKKHPEYANAPAEKQIGA